MEFITEYKKEDLIEFLTDWQKFQSELKTFKKENKVDFENKKTFMRTKYSYITIDEIFEHIRPILNKYNLSFFQEPECREDTTEVKAYTYICHSKTGIIVKLNGMWVPGGNDAQKMGSGLTYASRYGFVRIFGIGSSDDDDALSISNDNAQPKRKPANNKPLYQQKDFMAQAQEKPEEKTDKQKEIDRIKNDEVLSPIYNDILKINASMDYNALEELLARTYMSGNKTLMRGYDKMVAGLGYEVKGNNLLKPQIKGNQDGE